MIAQLLSVSFSLLVVAQFQPMAPAAANARVEGRVVDRDTSMPLPGAVVMLVPVASSIPPVAMAPPQALTNVNGEFAVQRVWAGRYRVAIQKTGFAPLSGVAEATIVDVKAGQLVSGLTFALNKESVIAGRIVSGGGDARPATTVAALGSGDGGSPAFSRTMQMSMTNDRGEFRLAGLAEGQYIVIALPQHRRPFDTSQVPRSTVPAPTFYPGTADREAAHIFDLGPAQTVDGIQFSIIDVPAHSISGIVVDEAGSPQANVALTLMGGPGVGSTQPIMARTDESGVFSIGGVVAGTYRVTAMIPTVVPVRGGAGQPGAAGGVAVGVPVVGGIQTQGLPSADVTVDNADVTDVRIVLTARRP